MSYQFYSENDVCEDLEHASNHLEGVVEALYDGNKSLEDLEFCIEEMCAALDVPFPKNKKLKIEKKEPEKSGIEKALEELEISSNNLMKTLDHLPKALSEVITEEYKKESTKSMKAIANSFEEAFEKECSNTTEELNIELQVASK